MRGKENGFTQTVKTRATKPKRTHLNIAAEAGFF